MPGFSTGLDIRNQLTMDYSKIGTFAPDSFTNVAVDLITNHNNSVPLFLYFSHLTPHAAHKSGPLPTPPFYDQSDQSFSYIKDENRRKYAALISNLDDSVGKVVEALKKNNMLSNSVILFLSDNGAPTVGPYKNYGSNSPLKGVKADDYYYFNKIKMKFSYLK